jgi:hypothetical protein
LVDNLTVFGQMTSRGHFPPFPEAQDARRSEHVRRTLKCPVFPRDSSTRLFVAKENDYEITQTINYGVLRGDDRRGIDPFGQG